MNTKITLLVGVVGLSLATIQAQSPPTFKSDKEKANFAYGLNIGTSFKQNNLEFDAEAFVRGVQEAIAGKVSLTPQEQKDAYMAYLQAQKSKLGEKNKADGEAFLAANKSKPGVKTFESGLQYKILTEGSGESPKPDDICVVKYRGTLIDGTEFDSSAKAPDGAATFSPNRVIPGWTEALTKMKPGAKWQLFIPAQLAYGENPRGGNIGPNSTLLFDVELVSFTNPPPPPPPLAPLTSDIIKVPSLEEMKKGAKIETIKADEVEKLQKEQAQDKKN
jgi:FKBP-type peptidyl-prolyl cis-trans isomerase FklB